MIISLSTISRLGEFSQKEAKKKKMKIGGNSLSHAGHWKAVMSCLVLWCPGRPPPSRGWQILVFLHQMGQLARTRTLANGTWNWMEKQTRRQLALASAIQSRWVLLLCLGPLPGCGSPDSLPLSAGHSCFCPWYHLLDTRGTRETAEGLSRPTLGCICGAVSDWIFYKEHQCYSFTHLWYMAEVTYILS